MPRWRWVVVLQCSAVFLGLVLPGESSSGRLYTEQDPVQILTRDSLRSALSRSHTAWILQFFSSWCGHCVQYSPTYKSLGADTRDWRGAIRVGVFDCALEENFDLCREYGIKFYPTFKFFKANGGEDERGTIYRGADRDVQSMRRLMIDVLQNHTRDQRPPLSPDLRPHSAEELLPLLGQKSDHHTALIIEDPQSYTGREVMLDLLPFSGVVVKRALSSERLLMDTLGITALPALHILHPNGSHYTQYMEKSLRVFLVSSLRSLPGLKRTTLTNSSVLNPPQGALSLPPQPWRDFSRSGLYWEDLESGLHYLFRVELASRASLEGVELQTFRELVTLLAKLYPGGGAVVKLMETLSDWLMSLPLQRIPYQAVLDLLDNKMKISGALLRQDLRWVACQGSSPGLRGYPCSLWTLFHVLSVARYSSPLALRQTSLDSSPAPVLAVMRGYITTFFGCDECGKNFDQAFTTDATAAITTPEQEVLWLWNQHNQVNYRLAGSLSDDPQFPKSAWPPPSLCASCHEENRGLHAWDQQEVLKFLLKHYGEGNLHTHGEGLEKKQGDGLQKQGEGLQRQGEYLQKKQGEELLKQGEGPLGRGEGLQKHREPTHRQKQPQPLRDQDGGDQEEGGAEERVGNRTLALGFNSVDMSLCLLLYICSCFILMLLFFIFRVRPRWKLRAHKFSV